MKDKFLFPLCKKRVGIWLYIISWHYDDGRSIWDGDPGVSCLYLIHIIKHKAFLSKNSGSNYRNSTTTHHLTSFDSPLVGLICVMRYRSNYIYSHLKQSKIYSSINMTLVFYSWASMDKSCTVLLVDCHFILQAIYTP